MFELVPEYKGRRVFELFSVAARVGSTSLRRVELGHARCFFDAAREARDQACCRSGAHEVEEPCSGGRDRLAELVLVRKLVGFVVFIGKIAIEMMEPCFDAMFRHEYEDAGLNRSVLHELAIMSSGIARIGIDDDDQHQLRRAELRR